MHPILFQIGPVTIYTYGLFVAIGFLAAFSLALKEAKREAISPNVISDLVCWMVIAGVIGARFIYVVYNFHTFLKHPLQIFALWKGGLVFIGGVVFGLLAMIFFVIKKGLNFWQLSDIFAPALALGQAFGRIGCLCAGCCYGRPTHVPWAIVFTDPNALAPTGIPLHPTEIYHSFCCFLITFILIWQKHRRDNFRLSNPDVPYGQIFALYLILHSIHRIVVEYFRGDYRPLFYDNISITQAFSFLFILIGVFIYFKKR